MQSHISSNEPIFIDVHRGLQAPRLVPSLKIFNHKYKTMDICVWGLNDSYQKPVILRHSKGCISSQDVFFHVMLTVAGSRKKP